MGADEVLVRGAAAAYKNRDASGEAFKGLDKFTEALRAREKALHEETKKEQKDISDRQKQAGDELMNIAVNLSPMAKTLGTDAYNNMKAEVSDIREQMFEAIQNDDQDAILDLNNRINELKSSSMADKDAYEAIIEGNEKGLYDTRAMTAEGLDAHKNFMNNPTRRYVKTEDGKTAYQWDVPVLDNNGEPIIDVLGNEQTETKTYTLDQLNDFAHDFEYENGGIVMDFVQEQKELFANGTTPDKANVRSKIEETIPMDAKKMRSWMYGNPTKNNNLRMFDYLMDHPFLNESTYRDLGVEDWDGNDVIDEKDLDSELSTMDKKDLVEKIMNIENPSVSHGVLVDAYTSISYKSILGDEGTDYTPDDQKLMGDEKTEDALDSGDVLRQNQAKVIEVLNDPIPGETATALIARIKRETGMNVGAKDLVRTEDGKGWRLIAEKGSGRTAEDYLGQ